MALNAGYNVTNFMFECNGKSAGYLSSFTAPTYEVEEIKQALGPDGITKVMAGNPKIGEGKLTINMSQTGEFWTIIQSVLDKSCVDFSSAVVLADQNYKGKRRIDMMGCMVKELSLPKLEAKDGKKHMELTVTFTVESLKFAPDSAVVQGALSKKAKNWLVSNFEPQGMPGGIKSESVMSVELPKIQAKIAEEHHGMFRLPSRHYSAWETSGLKTEHSSIGYGEVVAYCQKVIQDGAIDDSEYAKWGIDLKDQTMKKVLCTFDFDGTAPKKFTWAPELKGGQDSMATCTVDWMVEEFRWKNQHMEG